MYQKLFGQQVFMHEWQDTLDLTAKDLLPAEAAFYYNHHLPIDEILRPKDK